MFRKLLAVSVIAAIPAASFAGGPTISGFADITYSNDNDNSLFLANAEVDISNKLSDQVSVRLDTDFAITGADGTTVGVDGAGPKSGATIEQAYFAYTPIKPITVIGGVFNNPIGWEAEDAPDMYSISKGLIYGILDAETALYGNNIAGVAVAGAVGPATITVAALNDIKHNDLEKNSFAAVINVTPMKGLDLELGYVTQSNNANDTATAGNVLDVNLTYSGMGVTVGLEYLKPSKLIDKAIGTMLNYEINPMFNITGRYDISTPAGGGDDTTQYLIAGTFNAAKNLAVLAEFKNNDASGSDDKTVTLEFIASF